MKGLKKIITVIGFCITMIACGVSVPDSYTEKDELPNIYPDYADVTIPVNIAPLSFQIEEQVEDAVVRFSSGSDEILCEGVKAQPDIDEWRELVAKAKGNDITVEVARQHRLLHQLSTYLPLIRYLRGSYPQPALP